MIYIICGISSFFVAVIASTLGLGGSFLFIPLFTSLGLDYKLAVIPTALLLNLVTSLMAQTSYLKSKLTDVRAGLLMSVAAILFAQIGAFMNRFMPVDTLKLIFALLVFLVAIDIIFFNNKESEKRSDDYRINLVLLISAGCLAGTMSGLLGTGGGFIIMPTLLLAGIPAKRAAATSSLVVFFSSSSAIIGHLKTQELNLMLASVCIITVALGAKTGSILMTKRFRSKTIKKAFGVIMILIAIKFFYDTI